MKTMHLFAGAGGGLLGDLILGHEPIIAVEWDRYACQILRERVADGWFPSLHVWEGDVRLFDPSEYAGRVDCIHAGFPCQDISVAGKQKGLGEGTRSGLYREVLRIAGVVRPRYLFLENVSAILSNGLGDVLRDLASMGYDSRWCCVKASDVGAPHGRDRWWLLADSNKFASEVRRVDIANAETGRRRENIKRGCRIDDCGKSDTKENGTMGDTKKFQRNGSNDYRKYESRTSLSKFRDTSSEKDGLAYSSKQGLQRCKASRNNGENRTESRNEQPTGCSTGKEWFEVESDVGRVAHGVAARVDRLKALGNGQVPLQAALAWRLLSK